MVAPSPLGWVAYSHPNSRSPTDDDTSDHEDLMVVDEEPDLGFMNEAATLNMASLRTIPLVYLHTLPISLLVVCTRCQIGLVSQSVINHSRTEHGIVLTKDQKASINVILGWPGTITSPAATIPPKAPCEPIEGLEHHQGISCNLCDYCCITTLQP